MDGSLPGIRFRESAEASVEELVKDNVGRIDDTHLHSQELSTSPEAYVSVKLRRTGRWDKTAWRGFHKNVRLGQYFGWNIKLIEYI
jgi:hypothetical protein